MKIRVYLGVKTCDFFSLFSTFVVLHDLALFCFSTFCFLCFTSLVILAGFYTEVEPKILSLIVVFSSVFKRFCLSFCMQCGIIRPGYAHSKGLKAMNRLVIGNIVVHFVNSNFIAVMSAFNKDLTLFLPGLLLSCCKLG